MSAEEHLHMIKKNQTLVQGFFCSLIVLLYTNGKRDWTSVRSEILLHGSGCLELVARSDHPESCRRVRAYPSVDSTVLVITRVLILVVYL